MFPMAQQYHLQANQPNQPRAMGIGPQNSGSQRPVHQRMLIPDQNDLKSYGMQQQDAIANVLRAPLNLGGFF